MTDYETLGKYHIHSELGKGGFATVYRAVDTTLDREVALKVLDPLLLRDGAWVARFRQEARSAANLRHPHIVGIHEIGEVEGRLYIAMELARGGSLAEAIAARGRIPWAETLSLLEPICEALDYAHGQGVIHRDLKPANILLDSEAGPSLTDFGFARLLSDNSMSVSLSGGILGTPAYIAPEIWELDHAERPADIYALGCIVYEMLVGEALFSGKTPMQSMRAHDKGPQYPAAWPQDVPAGVTTVLAKALAREPEKRYATARTLWHALHDLEAQAETARAAAERAAVAAQWHAEAEAALAAGELSAAKMAVGRWLAATPEDARAKAMQAEIAQRMAEAERLAAPPVTVQEKPYVPPVYAPTAHAPTQPTATRAGGAQERKEPTLAMAPPAMPEKVKPSRHVSLLARIAGGGTLLVLCLLALWMMTEESGLFGSRDANNTPMATRSMPATQTPQPSITSIEKLRVAFIYIGPPGDLGWTYEHDRGRKILEEKLGDKVETAYIENVVEGPDAARVIRQYAREGYDMIFATSFGYMDYMYEVAQEFPDVKFEHCSGYKTLDNMAVYFGRIYQARYLSGIVAGKMTKNGNIGYVAAFPIPEVVRGINAFTLGVRSVNPNAKVTVVWTNTWYDPVKEREAAVALLDAGADIIAQHQDTTEPQKAAQERGALSIGYDSDMRAFVGDSVLTSPMWNWSEYYIDTVQAAIDGKWETRSYWGGLDDDIVRLADFSAKVPQDVRDLVEAAKKDIIQNDQIFCGPLRDQVGNEVVAAGQCLSDEEKLSMMFFVEGVVGTVPNN